jgi:hypothetical protein
MAATEGALGHCVHFLKANPAKGQRSSEIALNAQTIQRSNAIGHQSFAARFIDRRARPIGYQHFDTTQTKGDRRSEPHRSASNNYDVRSGHKPTKPRFR